MAQVSIHLLHYEDSIIYILKGINGQRFNKNKTKQKPKITQNKTKQNQPEKTQAVYSVL